MVKSPASSQKSIGIREHPLLAGGGGGTVDSGLLACGCNFKGVFFFLVSGGIRTTGGSSPTACSIGEEKGSNFCIPIFTN